MIYHGNNNSGGIVMEPSANVVTSEDSTIVGIRNNS